MPIGALIGAGASILGGLLARKSAKDQQSANTALQREFAQKGIQWRVADAKAAGLHPLAALGASGASYSPNPIVAGDMGIGSAGQQLGNAVSRMRAPVENASQKAFADANLRHLNAQTSLVEQQITNSRMRMMMELQRNSKPNPGIGATAQDPVKPIGSVDLQAVPRSSTASGSFGTAQAGIEPESQWVKGVSRGGQTIFYRAPNPAVIPDSDIMSPEYGWWLLRNLGGSSQPPPNRYKPDTHEWHYSLRDGGWTTRPRRAGEKATTYVRTK